MDNVGYKICLSTSVLLLTHPPGEGPSDHIIADLCTKFGITEDREREIKKNLSLVRNALLVLTGGAMIVESLTASDPLEKLLLFTISCIPLYSVGGKIFHGFYENHGLESSNYDYAEGIVNPNHSGLTAAGQILEH